MKRSLLTIAVGVGIALVIVFAVVWINVRHGATGGAETINIPSWLRGAPSCLGGLAGVVGVQVYCLIRAVRLHYGDIRQRGHKVLTTLLWVALLAATLVAWGGGLYMAALSWTL